MTGPGPTPEEVDTLLRVAARVPDHRKMVPFRFLVLEEGARDAFGKVLEKAAMNRDDEVGDMDPDIIRGLPSRAPVMIAVISKVDRAHRTPEWEQVLCAGAVCQNLLLAASAAGFAAQWLTEWYAYDETVGAALCLSDAERIAGFVYLGTAREEPLERPRPDMSEIISRWSASD